MAIRKAIVELGRDGVPAEDFDAWVAFVAEHIGERTEIDVAVEERSKREAQTDAIDAYGPDHAQCDADVAEVAEVLSALWGEFCGGAQ